MQADDWARLSPLLDELLELDEDARHLRLVRLRMESPELADEVEKLLRIEADQPGFMAQPVVHEVAMTPVEGDHLGPYRLVRLIGEGGMGQVWEAVRADGLYERRVALKLLRPGFADPKLRSRFTRERVILARLAHAYIARLLDAGVTTDGQPYLALEYIQGEPITDYARRLKLPLAERLRLYLQVCEAVSHAHANLVVHRDLKPGNILVTPAGDVRLLDFGIAKLLDEPAKEGTAELTRAGARAFTLHYAAPEQIRGEPVTTMTDVYSLGVVLYELLTGRKPYLLRRGSDAEWENAILEGEPIRPSLAVLRQDDTAAPASDRRLARALSGDLDNIVLKALRKPVEQRYASVEALSQDLRRHMEGRPVSARAPSFGYRLGKYLSRHVVAISVLTGVLTVLGLAVLGMSWQYRQALAEAERAQALQDFVASLFEQGGASGADRRIDVRTLLDSGVRRAEIELRNQPRPQLELLGLIARLRNGLGDYREALQVLRRQEESFRRLDGPLPPELVLESAIEHARALRALGQPRDCVETLLPARRVADANAGTRSILVAEYYAQLGRCHRLLGERDQARALFQRSLELRRAARGGGVEEAESLSDLALLQADAGAVDEAVAGLRLALDRLRVATGERHPLGVTIWRSLGGLHRQRSEVAQAEGAYRQAMDIALSLYGSQHPATIEVQRQLGALLVDLGRLDEAERTVTLAMQQLRERFGERHPDVASTYQSLGMIAFERGQFDTALLQLERAVAIWRQSSSAERLPTGLYQLAQVQLAAGQVDDAAASLGESLSLSRGRHGEAHGQVAVARRLGGEILAARGEHEAAREELASALDGLRSAYGASHPATALGELALARQLYPVDAEAAESLLHSVEQRFRGEGNESLRLRMWSRALRAEARCEGGDPAVGASQLDAILDELARDWPVSQLRRDVAAIRAACGGEALARLGRRR